jgi:hypothetical protein
MMETPFPFRTRRDNALDFGSMNCTLLTYCPWQKHGLAVALLMLVSLLLGCGSGYYPVEGQVVWKDGKPATELAGSLVIFECAEKKTSAQGVIQPDGKFKLTTLKPNDGAAAGEHVVLVMETGRKPQGGPDGTNLAPSKIDMRYATPSTSDLRATVKPGKNAVTLTVERGSAG